VNDIRFSLIFRFRYIFLIMTPAFHDAAVTNDISIVFFDIILILFLLFDISPTVYLIFFFTSLFYFFATKISFMIYLLSAR